VRASDEGASLTNVLSPHSARMAERGKDTGNVRGPRNNLVKRKSTVDSLFTVLNKNGLVKTQVRSKQKRALEIIDLSFGQSGVTETGKSETFEDFWKRVKSDIPGQEAPVEEKPKAVEKSVHVDEEVLDPLASIRVKCITNIKEDDGEGDDAWSEEENNFYAQVHTLRLCYNCLVSLQGIGKALFDLGVFNLCWLELSHNNIHTLSEDLLEIRTLKILHLQRNKIKKLSEVKKLARLPNLQKLSLSANPIAMEQGYRQIVLNVLPNLLSLDNSRLTATEKRNAKIWLQTSPKSGKVHNFFSKLKL